MIFKIICNKQKKKKKEKKKRNYELIIKVSYENLKKMKIRSSLKIWYFVELCEREKRERERWEERERWKMERDICILSNLIQNFAKIIWLKKVYCLNA